MLEGIWWTCVVFWFYICNLKICWFCIIFSIQNGTRNGGCFRRCHGSCCAFLPSCRAPGGDGWAFPKGKSQQNGNAELWSASLRVSGKALKWIRWWLHSDFWKAHPKKNAARHWCLFKEGHFSFLDRCMKSRKPFSPTSSNFCRSGGSCFPIFFPAVRCGSCWGGSSFQELQPCKETFAWDSPGKLEPQFGFISRTATVRQSALRQSSSSWAWATSDFGNCGEQSMNDCKLLTYS